MKLGIALFAAATLAGMLDGAPALAQTSAAADKFAATTLDIAGHGEVKAPPDMATLTLGVTTQDETAAGAMQSNRTAMAKVVAALRAAGVAPADLQTSTLGLNPQYVFAQGAAPKLSGYSATNQVSVIVEDLGRLAEAMDAAVGAGATNVNQVSFGLRSRGAALNAARLAAVKDLDDKAAIFADAAGYHIRRLVNLHETTSQAPAPRVMMLAAAAGTTPTPIETGQIVVTVDVSGEFELSH